jgi:hypothetical protein
LETRKKFRTPYLRQTALNRYTVEKQSLAAGWRIAAQIPLQEKRGWTACLREIGFLA